ncbi:MAG: hypothetical protein PHO09_13945 [Sphaerochaeta sp.]|nr:hypothetical protein [Sphaerochaeta sp.]
MKIGYHHLLNFRVQGASRSYAFGFYGENTLALVKKQKNYRVLAQIPFQLALEQMYLLSVSVFGNRILASIDGKIVFDYCNTENPYLYGQVGFTVLQGSHCHFSNLNITACHAPSVLH